MVPASYKSSRAASKYFTTLQFRRDNQWVRVVVFFTHVEGAALNTDQFFRRKKNFQADSHPSFNQQIPNIGFWVLNKLWFRRCREIGPRYSYKPRLTTSNIVGSRCVRSYVAKSLTCFKLCPTARNNMQQGVQTDATTMATSTKTSL